MRTLTVILNRPSIEIAVNEHRHAIPPHQLVVADERASVVCSSGQWQQFSYSAGNLYDLYCRLYDLLDNRSSGVFYRQPLCSMPVEEDMFRVMTLLADSDSMALLRFVYVYCLGYDRQYFSALLKFYTASDQAFFEFLEAHYLNPWSVARFAKELGMPLRKLNDFFQEKFGTTVKQWLLERRLDHARTLLLSTSTRIVDIALECGFSHHAHFADSFRKRYQRSPTEVRDSGQLSSA